MSISQTPAYNLKAVLKETGIAADTLRAWERRYGLPMPERTSGGHRLYSQRDIETIKWLMRQQAEGLSISRAVDLWNEQTASGSDPLAGTVPSGPAVPSGGSLDTAREEWVRACLDFDESAADQAVNQAFAMHPLEDVVTQVIQRGLREIGDKWYVHEASVQQEHFASALAQRRLDGLVAASPPPTRPRCVLIGCTPGERHTISALLLSLLLRRRGLPVIYLGADVPVMQFAETVGKVQPALVVLISQQLHTAGNLRNVAASLIKSRLPVTYGGRIFNLLPELRELIPAHFLGETIPEAVHNIELLLSDGPKTPAVIPPVNEHQDTALLFRRNRPMIELNAMAEANKLGLPFEYINQSIQYMGDNLQSVLLLGRLDALHLELDWLRGILLQHGADQTGLNPFLLAYAASIDSTMGHAGRPIAQWLAGQAGE
jgi:DNA-binding transcriptional MerR regulator